MRRDMKSWWKNYHSFLWNKLERIFDFRCLVIFFFTYTKSVICRLSNFFFFYFSLKGNNEELFICKWFFANTISDKWDNFSGFKKLPRHRINDAIFCVFFFGSQIWIRTLAKKKIYIPVYTAQVWARGRNLSTGEVHWRFTECCAADLKKNSSHNFFCRWCFWIFDYYSETSV